MTQTAKEIRHAIRAVTCIDNYKLDHRRQYPPKTQFIYSNFTPRASRIEGVDYAVFFGLQAFLKEWMQDAFADFFAADEDEAVSAYVTLVTSVIGPNEVGEDHIRALHRLQYVPLRFCALPEGTKVPLRVPMFTIENTHPDFFWLTNYIETALSAQLWLPCTSATTAAHFRQVLDEWAEKTSSTPAFVDWQGHDFSMRGMEGVQGAALSGAGHLLSFTGTDTLPAIQWIEDYYPGSDNGLIGGSVAATEHSVMCAGGSETEELTFKRLLNLYPTGIVAVVADTWNLWANLTDTLPALKDQIMSRDGKLVIRPDSGDPVDIICGDPEAPEGTPAFKGVAQLLWDEFGGTVNDKGFKELDPHVGMIYGDSINFARARSMCKRLALNGFASTNIVLGIGSFSYQLVTRDTLGFAMKATWAEIDGVGYDLWKDPITDDGTKKSARGRLAVLIDPVTNRLSCKMSATTQEEAQSFLEPVWEDGKFIREYSFAEVRATLKSQ